MVHCRFAGRAYGSLWELWDDGERHASLSCSAFLREFYPGTVRVEPLANFSVERDSLSVSMTSRRSSSVKPWIIRNKSNQFLKENIVRVRRSSLILSSTVCASTACSAMQPVRYTGYSQTSLVRQLLRWRTATTSTLEIRGNRSGKKWCLAMKRCGSARLLVNVRLSVPKMSILRERSNKRRRLEHLIL
jgi:succinate dehydrogenase/fumarate reductase-like Fe-S protein